LTTELKSSSEGTCKSFKTLRRARGRKVNWLCMQG